MERNISNKHRVVIKGKQSQIKVAKLELIHNYETLQG